ncbi:ATP-binding protein [soil metagenome]
MRVLRRLSIRWRITIGSVVIGAVLLTGAGFAFRAQVEQVQIASDKKLLYDASTPYLGEITAHPDQIDPPAGEQHVAVVNPAGKAVVTNLPAALNTQLSSLVQLPDGSNFLTADRSHYLVIIRTVATPEGDWHIVASRDERLTAAIVSNVSRVLVGGIALLLIGFGIASWLLATAALRPVAQMRRRADALRASGSSQPLPVGEARDELAALATTLNEFIGSVRDTAAREKQMVSDASHELRTPLAVLQAQLELAHLSEGDAQLLAKDLYLAEETAHRLSRIATNLLTLSAVEASHENRATSWAALSDEFVQASDRARLLASTRGSTVEFDLDEIRDDSSYRLSESHLGQIVDNLISNALAATDRDGHVLATLERSEGGLRLVVEDSGPGMPAEFIPVALDRFTRPENHRGDTGGSGLGLAIVAAIVAAANGRIVLANRAEGGLIVTVDIPAHEPQNRPPL